MRMRVDCLVEHVVAMKSSGMWGVNVTPGAQRQSLWEGTLTVAHCFQPTSIESYEK